MSTSSSKISQEDKDLWQRYTESPCSPIIVSKINESVQHRDKISKILDLHGMTLQEAYQHTVKFLTAHRAFGTKSVLVICGKGDKISREIQHWCSSVQGVSGCNPIIDSTGEAGSYRVRFFKKR